MSVSELAATSSSSLVTEPSTATPEGSIAKATTPYPTPTPGASLLLSFTLERTSILIIGSSSLAASRAFASLEAFASNVVVLCHGGYAVCCDELKWRSDRGEVSIVDWNGQEDGLKSYLEDETTPRFRFACITDTTSSSPHKRSKSSASQLYAILSSFHIPTNTTDHPSLCDFTFTSSHRFTNHVTGEPSALQVGVTTNGKGCRLAGRIKRDIVSSGVKREAAEAVRKVGLMREMSSATNDDDDEEAGVSTPNRPVPQRSLSETTEEEGKRRMKWIAQVSEYWPLPSLASLSTSDMESILAGDHYTSPSTTPSTTTSRHGLDITPKGRIYLVGSGPGHPGLLTIATRTVLTEMAQLVLSDKLVPEAILALIPKGVEVKIARKFPGNADGAQEEMMRLAVDAANQGKVVVRLKQGDPVVYGRAGEEVLYFRSHGYESIVIPGVSSAIAAPTMAGIPVTQRGAAESFVACTGVGRKGKEVKLPGYERGRSVVVLMGVARLPQIVDTFTNEEMEAWRRNGPAYPLNTPIALIERASMPDQRVLLSTLGDIVQALESLGEQRPPGMFVVGWAVLSLWGEGDVSMLEDGAEEGDEDRVRRWLGGEGKRWIVREGLGDGWEGLE